MLVKFSLKSTSEYPDTQTDRQIHLFDNNIIKWLQPSSPFQTNTANINQKMIQYFLYL